MSQLLLNQMCTRCPTMTYKPVLGNLGDPVIRHHLSDITTLPQELKKMVL